MQITYPTTVAPLASVAIETASTAPDAVNLIVQIVLAVTALISLFRGKK